MLAMDTVAARRNDLEAGFHLVFVDPQQFCELAISMRPLRRQDDRPAGLRGLVDADTGECFVTESVRLQRYVERQEG